MRLVFVTQVLDADDANLGATVAMLRALAARCDELVVLCGRVGAHDLPPSCRVETFGAPTRTGRGLRYAAALRRALHPRPDALLAHMCPIYLVLAAPLARPARVPLLLWYTHWSVTATLRLADRLADAVLSVERRSYPLPSSRVHAIGHGIDTRQFAPGATGGRDGEPLALLALGRTSPSKGLVTLLHGLGLARRAGVSARLELRGPSLTGEERRHREELTRLVSSLALDGAAHLEAPLPRSRVPELLRGADALVNAHAGRDGGGALDKVVYESAACAVPVLACNPAFDALLADLPVELRFRSGDPESFARVLGGLAAGGPELRAAAGRELRRRVEAGHSVDTWAGGVLRVVSEVA